MISMVMITLSFYLHFVYSLKEGFLLEKLEKIVQLRPFVFVLKKLDFGLCVLPGSSPGWIQGFPRKDGISKKDRNRERDKERILRLRK